MHSKKRSLRVMLAETADELGRLSDRLVQEGSPDLAMQCRNLGHQLWIRLAEKINAGEVAFQEEKVR